MSDDSGSPPATMLHHLLGHCVGVKEARHAHHAHDVDAAPAAITAEHRLHPVIIAGLDETPGGLLVVDEAAREARLRGATLRIVHVQSATNLAERRDADRSAGAELLSQAVDRVHSREPDVVVSTQLLVGTPAGRLIEASANADLVVVSHCGRDPRGGHFADSVGAHLVTYGHSPVLIVRRPSRTVVPDRRGHPVFVGVDGSLASWAAVQFAVGEAGLRGTRLIAVYASRRPTPASG